MQSKQFDSERLRTRQLPQTQPTPHASLDNIQLVSNLKGLCHAILVSF